MYVVLKGSVTLDTDVVESDLLHFHKKKDLHEKDIRQRLKVKTAWGDIRVFSQWRLHAERYFFTESKKLHLGYN